MMLCVPVWALHDTDGIVNCTILFTRARWLKQSSTWLFGHVMPVCSMWHWWNHQYYQSISEFKIIKKRCNMTVIWHYWHWHQHHVMQMALLMSPLYSLSQDSWNNVKYIYFGYMMPLMLMLALHDTTGIKNCTTAFHTSRQLKADQHDFMVIDATGTGISVTCCQKHHQLHHGIPTSW